MIVGPFQWQARGLVPGPSPAGEIKLQHGAPFEIYAADDSEMVQGFPHTLAYKAVFQSLMDNRRREDTRERGQAGRVSS